MSLIFPGPVVLPLPESCSWWHRSEWSLPWDLCQRHHAGCHSRSPLPAVPHHCKLCLCLFICHSHLKQPQPWSLQPSPCYIIQACVLSFQIFLWEFISFPSRAAPAHRPKSVLNPDLDSMTHLTAGFQCSAGCLIHSFTHLSIYFFKNSLTHWSNFQSLIDWARGDCMCN